MKLKESKMKYDELSCSVTDSAAAVESHLSTAVSLTETAAAAAQCC